MKSFVGRGLVPRRVVGIERAAGYKPCGRRRPRPYRRVVLIALTTGLLLVGAAHAQPVAGSLGALLPSPDKPQELAVALKLLLGFSVLSLAPALLIMLTCFTRIIIILSFNLGLSAAIRMRQLAEEKNMDLSVCLIEKGAQIGSHIIS